MEIIDFINAMKGCNKIVFKLDGVGEKEYNTEEFKMIVGLCETLVANTPCFTCKHKQVCETQYGRIGIDVEDCTAIQGTHFCLADWDQFIELNKCKCRKEF